MFNVTRKGFDTPLDMLIGDQDLFHFSPPADGHRNLRPGSSCFGAQAHGYLGLETVRTIAWEWLFEQRWKLVQTKLGPGFHLFAFFSQLLNRDEFHLRDYLFVFFDLARGV